MKFIDSFIRIVMRIDSTPRGVALSTLFFLALVAASAILFAVLGASP